MLNFFRQRLILRRLRKIWRQKNKHNFTEMVNPFDINCVSVGKYTYGGIQVYNYNIGEKLIIGNFCSIAKEVMFILNADHYLNNISTYPFKVKVAGAKYEATSKGDIIIDDDVWIGYRATIMSGVHIGQGAVVAAGALVVKNVPPYAIVGGVPAQVIKYRFEIDIRQKLMEIDYEKLDKNIILKQLDDLYIPLNNIKQLKWIPKKRLEVNNEVN